MPARRKHSPDRTNPARTELSLPERGTRQDSVSALERDFRSARAARPMASEKPHLAGVSAPTREDRRGRRGARRLISSPPQSPHRGRALRVQTFGTERRGALRRPFSGCFSLQGGGVSVAANRGLFSIFPEWEQGRSPRVLGGEAAGGRSVRIKGPPRLHHRVALRDLPASWESRACGSCWSARAGRSARRRWKGRSWPWVSLTRRRCRGADSRLGCAPSSTFTAPPQSPQLCDCTPSDWNSGFIAEGQCLTLPSALVLSPGKWG